jgi:gas vesicle protein|tara:strand:+ start:2204 stop:2851 length:648 start_codon:yes stop_codon:yes gene_type:complete
VSENGIKLGQLLCDEDVITKRQLSKALQEQVKGRKGTLGEILVDMGVCSFEDITDAMMNHNSDTQKHEEKHEEIHKEPIPTPVVQPTIVEEPKVEEPVELSEEKVMGTKFSMSVQTIVGLITLISTAVGGYYMLLQEIDEAKELPKIDIEKIFTDEYPSKPDGHNWPRSYEQYKNQVGGLQEDMDAVYDMLDEYEETIKDLQKDIKDLERRKKDK